MKALYCINSRLESPEYGKVESTSLSMRANTSISLWSDEPNEF